MFEAVLAKVSQNEKIKKYLLETGDAVLVETSPYDAIWGIKQGKFDRNQKYNPAWKTLLLGEVKIN